MGHSSAVAVARRLCSLTSLVLTLLWARCAFGQQWVGSTGDWFSAANWNNNQIPTAATTASIFNGGTAQISSGNAVSGELGILSGSAIILSGDGTLTGGTEIVDGGTFTQTGGTNSANGQSGLFVGYGAGSSSIYNLSGSGSLGSSTQEIVGDEGRGYFNQTGGTNSTPELDVGGNTKYSGSSGVYKLSSGSLYAPTTYVGSFENYAGGQSGVLTIAGGQLIATTFTVSNTPGTVVNLDSGTLSTTTLNAGGAFNIRGGALAVSGFAYVEGAAGGPIVQTGGSASVSEELVIGPALGASAASYNLEVGSLSSGWITVNSGGSFTNSGSVTVMGTTRSDGPSDGQGTFVQTTTGTLTAQINSSQGLFGQLFAANVNLSGTLKAVLGSGYSAASPPPANASYRIISSGSLNGAFNDGNDLVEAKLGTGVNNVGTNSAGLFDVSYASSGVTLTNFHQIHVLSYGVNFGNGSVLGGVDASKVSQAFSHIAGVVDNNRVSLSSAAFDNLGTLTSDISSLASSVHPGDTCIFFISTHGTFDPSQSGQETPITRQIELTSSGNVITGTTSSPSELYLSDAGDTVSGSGLVKAFGAPIWTSVNKLFIVDACYSGGLWSGPNGAPGYLSGLPHSAIIASSPEADFSKAVPSGPNAGEGYLAIGVEEALANLGTNEFDFNSLLAQVTADVTAEELQYDSNGFIKSPQIVWGGGPVAGADELFGQATSDFSLGLVQSVDAPEPSFGLLVFLLAALWIATDRKSRAGIARTSQE